MASHSPHSPRPASTAFSIARWSASQKTVSCKACGKPIVKGEYGVLLRGEPDERGFPLLDRYCLPCKGAERHFCADACGRIVGVSGMTISRWIRAGKVSASYIGQHHAIPLSEVLRIKEEITAEAA